MSQHIHSWVDGLLAIRDRAYATRGFVELDDGSRWPRTTGADVIAIAAFVDPSVKRHGTPGTRVHNGSGELIEFRGVRRRGTDRKKVGEKDRGLEFRIAGGCLGSDGSSSSRVGVAGTTVAAWV